MSARHAGDQLSGLSRHARDFRKALAFPVTAGCVACEKSCATLLDERDERKPVTRRSHVTLIGTGRCSLMLSAGRDVVLGTIVI